MSSRLAKLEKVNLLALEGGGMAAIAHVPSLSALEKAGRLGVLKKVAGTSAGALLALLIVLSYTSGEILSIMRSTDWSKWGGSLRWWKVGTALAMFYRWIRTWGLYPLDAPRSWILTRLAEKGYGEETTFAQLTAARGMELIVIATNQDKAKAVVFSSSTTPEVPVLDAILASMAIPVYFPPVKINGDNYSDGGTTWNDPLKLFEGMPLASMLGLRVDTSAEVTDDFPRVGGPIQQIIRTLSIALRAANRTHISQELFVRVIRAITDISATSFNLDSNQESGLLRAGELAVAQFLEAA